jgi:Sulfotransferase family
MNLHAVAVSDKDQPVKGALRSHPAFICIGSQKAGTQWLYDQAASHPDVWMPPIKEVKYFAKPFHKTKDFAEKKLRSMRKRNASVKARRDVAFLQRIIKAKNTGRRPCLTEYQKLFKSAGACVTGDISPQYAKIDPPTVQEIARALPHCRFVFLVREPVSRFWSMVNMQVRYEKADPSTATDIQALRTFLTNPRKAHLNFQSRAIPIWREAAGDRFKTFVMDDLKTDADAYRRAVFEHIGLNGDLCAIAANYNKKSTKVVLPLPPHFKTFLADYFRAETEALQSLLGGSTLKWTET